ncbi:MAG: DUF4440 domain-containing protein [Rubricoccaceae bacterium]|nr:DUF4440 domain-containing protein [Rubricoccaceae bacterium]
MDRLFLFSLLALALAACQTPETETTEPTATPVTNVSDPAADRAAIEAMTAEYTRAVQAADADAVSALYADDATIHPPNEPSVSGREALDAYFATIHAEPQAITFVTEDVVVSESADLAYEVGSWEEGGATSKYLTVYLRTPEGWRIVADSWSADAPTTIN